MTHPADDRRLTWSLDCQSRELVHGGRRTRLAEKPFLVLTALVEAGGAVVTRVALQQRLWSDDTFVDFDNNLNSAVATLRHVLGDSARSPVYIETIPKVGYRLLRHPHAVRAADAITATTSPAATVAADAAGAPAWSVTFASIAAGLVAVVIVVSALVSLRSDARSDEPRTVMSTAALGELQRGRFLRARYLATHRDVAGLEQARAAFGRARALDVTAAAEAEAEEADTLVELAFAGALGFRDGLTQARALAQAALGRDRQNASALRVSGLASLFLDWDFDAAAHRIDRAAALAPDDARTALARATLLAATGRAAEAVAAAERAVALDPESNFVRADLALFYLAAGRLQDAADTSRRVLEVAPDFVPALVHVVIAHERLEQWDLAARAALALLQATDAPAGVLDRASTGPARDAVRAWHEWDLARVQQTDARALAGEVAIAVRFAAVGDRERALDHLERALARREAMLVFVRAFPEFGALRSDPRFERLVRAIGRS